MNLNRAMHNDEVVVMLLGTDKEETKLVDWQINGNKEANMIKNRLIGSVIGILNKNQEEMELECLPANQQHK